MFANRSTTPQQWEDYSRYNKERADAEMESSRRLREAIHHTIHQTDNDLAAQHKATDYALRKRMHEFEKAIDELKWQKDQVTCYLSFGNRKKSHACLRFSSIIYDLLIIVFICSMQTEEEIAELEEDIRRTNEAIKAKVNPMKLAQTRLENRTYRPNVELCRDNPQYGLIDEVKQLEATKLALEEKLKQQQYVNVCSLIARLK